MVVKPVDGGLELKPDRDSIEQQNPAAGTRARLVVWYDYQGARFAHVARPGDLLFMPTAGN